LKLTQLVTHSQVFLTDVTECTSIHMQDLTTLLWVTKVLLRSTQVCSTAHTYHYRWFVRLGKTASSQKSGSKLVTAWYRTHSQMVLLQQLRVLLHRTPTSTTEEFVYRTYSNNKKKGGSTAPLYYKLGDLRISLFFISVSLHNVHSKPF